MVSAGSCSLQVTTATCKQRVTGLQSKTTPRAPSNFDRWVAASCRALVLGSRLDDF